MIFLKLLLTALFWGGTFISGRTLGALGVHPTAAAFLRFTVSSVLLVILVVLRMGRIPALPSRLWLKMGLLGLTGVFSYNILFFWGLGLVEAGRASIIIAISPAMIALGASLIFGQRLGIPRCLGVVASIIGAMTAISSGNPAALLSGGIGLGDLLIFGCVLSWAAYSLIGKAVLSDTSPLVSVTYSSAIGALMLLPAALTNGLVEALPTYTLPEWLNIGYLGVFGTVIGFVWYYEGIEKIGAAKASLFINFVPIFAILLSASLLGERLTMSLAVGAVMVVCGVYVTNNGFSFPARQRRLAGLERRFKKGKGESLVNSMD